MCNAFLKLNQIFYILVFYWIHVAVLSQFVLDVVASLRQAVCMATQYASAPCKLTISSHLFARWHLFRHIGYLRHQQQVDLLTLKVHGVLVTCDVATSVPILVFLGLSVLELDPMYATDRHQTKASLNASALWGRGGGIKTANCALWILSHCPNFCCSQQHFDQASRRAASEFHSAIFCIIKL